MNVAIILLGGNGTRFGENTPKQFFLLKNKPLCYYTIKSFNDSPLIDKIVLVIDEEYKNQYQEIVTKYNLDKVAKYVQGGKTRQQSSFAGLLSLENELNKDDNVLIHDGARPLLDKEIIENNINELNKFDGIVTGIYSEDTVSIVKGGLLHSYTDRTQVFRVQTPQSFKYGVILCAHKKYANESLTDDAQLLMKENIQVGVVLGNKKLLKVTTKEDVKYIEDYLNE
mgnify:CR=1 FL=1